MEVLEGELLFTASGTAYKLASTTSKGRHVLATRNINNGELLLAERATLKCISTKQMLSASPDAIQQGSIALSMLQPQWLSEINEAQRVEAMKELTKSSDAYASDTLVLFWIKWKLNRSKHSSSRIISNRMLPGPKVRRGCFQADINVQPFMQTKLVAANEAKWQC